MAGSEAVAVAMAAATAAGVTEAGTVVPVTVVLVSNGVARQSHEAAAREFGSLILLDEYSPAALGNAVKIMFGKGTVG